VLEATLRELGEEFGELPADVVAFVKALDIRNLTLAALRDMPNVAPDGLPPPYSRFSLYDISFDAYLLTQMIIWSPCVIAGKYHLERIYCTADFGSQRFSSLQCNVCAGTMSFDDPNIQVGPSFNINSLQGYLDWEVTQLPSATVATASLRARRPWRGRPTQRAGLSRSSTSANSSTSTTSRRWRCSAHSR
jgi:hypothetical protein